MNYALIVGKLLAPPSYNKTKKGYVIEMCVATTTNYVTEQHNVKVFRKSVEFYKNLVTNSDVLIEGKIRSEEVERDGDKQLIKWIYADKVEKI